MDAKKKRLIISNLFLILFLFLTVSFNKDYLRPEFADNHFLKAITDCLPNFAAAFFISLAIINGIITKNLKFDRLIVYFVSILIFLILSFEEFVPLWGASEVFDRADVYASGIGSLFALIIFEFIKFRKKKDTN